MNINRLTNYMPVDEPDSQASRLDDFVTHLERHETRIRRFLATLLFNKTEIDDLFQRTSLILWSKFRQYRADGDFAAWACQIAKFEVKNFLRAKTRDRLQFSDEVVSSLADVRLGVGANTDQRQEALSRCLEKLSPSDRKIIDQCYGYESTTTKEAAGQLGRPVNTLYKALNRIRRVLYKCVKHATEERG
jgi:RNA polymerase sigma-70 factor (ECF subfamily)